MKRRWPVLIVPGRLAGCSPTVNTDYAADADFSRFRTFRYRERKALVWRTIGSDALGKNPDRNSNRINAMIERALRGFPPR